MALSGNVRKLANLLADDKSVWDIASALRDPDFQLSGDVRGHYEPHR